MGWESWLNFRLPTYQSYGISFTDVTCSRAGHYRKVDSSRRPHHHEYDIIYMGGRDINLSKFLPILSTKHDAHLMKNYDIDCIWLQRFGCHAQNENIKFSFIFFHTCRLHKHILNESTSTYIGHSQNITATPSIWKQKFLRQYWQLIKGNFGTILAHLWDSYETTFWRKKLWWKDFIVFWSH